MSWYLAGVGVAPGLVLGRFANAGLALSQDDTGVLRRVHHLLACPVQQPAVGGVRDGLGLHRRVQHHGVQAGALDHAATAGRLDALVQQPLAAGLANALSPRTRLDGSHGSAYLK